MDKVKIGVIGCGNISDLYFSNLKGRYARELELVSCADILSVKAQEAAKKWDIHADTVEGMLRDKAIEIIINLTEPNAHLQINRQILEAGKHAYCEKPLALSFEAAKDLVRLAESKNLYISCAPDTFLGAGIQACREFIDKGWLGKVVCGTANMVCPGHEIWHPNPAFYYKPGGGPMLDMGPYYISALVAMLGPIKRISGFCTSGRAVRTITSQPQRGQSIEAEVPTHYAGILEFAGGAIVNILMSFEVWNSKLPRLEIHGTAGSIYGPNPDSFSGPVFLTRAESVVDQLMDVDTAASGVKGTLFDKAALAKEMPLPYHDPHKKIRGLGVLDLAHAIRLDRTPKISHDFILHVTEALFAFEASARDRGVYDMATSCARPAPMPTDSAFDTLD